MKLTNILVHDYQGDCSCKTEGPYSVNNQEYCLILNGDNFEIKKVEDYFILPMRESPVDDQTIKDAFMFIENNYNVSRVNTDDLFLNNIISKKQVPGLKYKYKIPNPEFLGSLVKNIKYYGMFIMINRIVKV